MVAPLSFQMVKTGCFVSPDFSGFASMFSLRLVSLSFAAPYSNIGSQIVIRHKRTVTRLPAMPEYRKLKAIGGFLIRHMASLLCRQRQYSAGCFAIHQAPTSQSRQKSALVGIHFLEEQFRVHHYKIGRHGCLLAA